TFSGLTVPNGSLTVQSGSLTLNGTTTIPAGVTLGITGGTLTNNGSLNILGTFSDTGGTFDGTGALTSSGSVSLGGGTFTNAITNTGSVTVASGATFTQLFPNQGTFDLPSGTATFSNGFTQNGGTVNLGSSIASPGSITVGGSGFNLVSGTVSGSGTITGNVSIGSGTLNPGYSPGALTIAGNLILSATSATKIEIDGPTPGTAGVTYDYVNVLGSATLAGTLNVVGFGAYAASAPPAGSSFSFMSFGSSSGGFGTVNLPAPWGINLVAGATGLQLVMPGQTFLSPAPPPTTSAFDSGLQQSMDLLAGLAEKASTNTIAVPNASDDQELKQCR
ncbi:MAG TPA: hypothetical protein VMB75_01630, partial [Rhodocyclaceae bacterium]|nr:hypothetical protein [Rhodocyclaceae bacterium]